LRHPGDTTQLTLVSGLFDLSRRESERRTAVDRIQRNAGLVLSMPLPLVVFVDPELASWVRRTRDELGLDHLTSVIPRRFEELAAHQLRDSISDLPLSSNGDPRKDTANYAILGWSKVDLVLETIEASPFGGSHYAWIDLGLGHVAQQPLAPPRPTDAITLHQMRPVKPWEVEDRREFHRWEHGTVCGGFFRGSAARFRELIPAFHRERDTAIAAGVLPNEQSILSALTVDHPKLFEFTFGDYPSILSNSEYIRGDVPYILASAAQCRRGQQWAEALERCARIRTAVTAGVLELEAELADLLDLEEAAARAEDPEPLLARTDPNASAAAPSIALCMIIRDEAAVLSRCLESVKGLISSWVIVDTGSTDGTRELITSLLSDIPGKLHQRRWVDFGHNRSELLELAKGAADFLLLIDADMTVEWELPLPRLDADAHYVRQLDHGLEYSIPRLVSGAHPWRYLGATHEYLTSDEHFTRGSVDGIRVVHHGDGGSKSDKFERDRALLETALDRDPDDQRTIFYLAQTCRDMGDRGRAIELYRRRVALGGWDEEVFYAAFQLGRLMSDIHWAAGLPLLLEAWERRPSRVEPLYEIAHRARAAGEVGVAHLATSLGVDIPLSKDSLFVHSWPYTWGLRFEHSVACAHVGDLGTARRLTADMLAEPDIPDVLLPHLRHNQTWLDEQPESVEVDEGSSHIRLRTVVPSRPLPLVSSLAPGVTTTAYPPIGDAALRDTNPTIAADGDGFLGVVRSVNYEIVDGRYRMLDGGRTVVNRNHVVRHDHGLTITGISLLTEPTLPPRHPSAVQGFEDLRLFQWRGAWWATATNRDLAPDQICRIVLLELDIDAAHITKVRPLPSPVPDRHEKNWMPVVRGDDLFFVYSCQPLVVLQYDLDTGELSEAARTNTDFRFTSLRGSSQGLAIDEGTLLVVHEAWEFEGLRRYGHRFMSLDAGFRPTGISAPFAFTHDGIEFCAGLTRRDDDIVLTYGIGDHSASMTTIPLASIINLIEPLPSAQRVG
jgi:tetratricopeptide (TPR) repeat protein